MQKLFIGESAGAILVAPDIEYSKDTDNPLMAPNLKSYEALNIVDFYPVPHYNDSHTCYRQRETNRFKKGLKSSYDFELTC